MAATAVLFSSFGVLLLGKLGLVYHGDAVVLLSMFCVCPDGKPKLDLA